MIRPLASILAALRFVAPSFEPAEEAAARVQIEAGAQGFDPYTMLAYVEHESDWDEKAAGDFVAGDMLGLGQIRLQNYPVCWAWERHDEAACQKQRALLLEWEPNLTETARMFGEFRAYCERRVGKSDARFWLQPMTGWDAVRHTTCGHRHGKPLPVPEGVAKILRRRAELARRF